MDPTKTLKTEIKSQLRTEILYFIDLICMVIEK